MRLWEIETEDKTAEPWVTDNTWHRYTVVALTFKSAISKVEKQMSEYERVKCVEYQGKVDA